jgi:hypothetical protein
MQVNIIIGILFIVIPILFNTFFGLLAKNFDYPDVLRRPTSEVLASFSMGGTRLVMTWWMFMLTAVGFIPIAVSIPFVFSEESQVLTIFVIAVGILAGLVQFLGLSRWPFLVPYLARESAKNDPEKSFAIDLIFQSVNRYLGVAVGEHLGYLFTGVWTIASSVVILQGSGSSFSLAIIGLIIGILLTLCSLEFVGSNEEEGWRIAALMTPFTYVAWSIWLIALGIKIMNLGL